MTAIPPLIKYDKPLPKYLIHLLFKMSASLILKKKPPKEHKFLIFLKGRYFVMGGSIDMNVGAFWETSVGFKKSVILQLLLESIWMSKVGRNSTAFKRSCFSVFYLNLTSRTLQGLSRMTYSRFVAFVDLKILVNLVSINDISKILKTVQRSLTFILNVLSESSI